eukprot:g18105.t1
MGDFESVPVPGILGVQGMSDDDGHGVELGAANEREPAADGVEPESKAMALSDILQMGDEIDGGDLHDGQDDVDVDDNDDDDFQDGDRSHPGGSSNGHRRSSTASLLSNIRQRQEPTVRGHSENQASYRTAMSDYHMLAFSSQRSGRHEMEGLAYYSAGVTMDSMGQYPKALDSYKKFLVVCKALKDPFLEGVCHNCMGVDYMLMACPPGSSMQGADDAGSGVAHSNIGLCHGLLGDYPRAAKHHQEALRVALRVQSASAQSVAVGNLGTLAMRQGDRQTAQACLEQHLQLVQQLGDWQGEINAWSRMAQLATAGGEPSAKGGGEAENVGGDNAIAGGVRDGVDADGAGDRNRSAPGGRVTGTMGQDAVARALWCFERAAALAKAHDEVSTLKRLHCDMGVVRGNASMDDYFRSLRKTALQARSGP